MTLNLIGIGVDLSDLTVFGCSMVSSCKKVSVLHSKYLPYSKTELEKCLMKSISVLSHENLFEELESILQEISSTKEDYALLMPGNPFCENYYPKISSLCSNFNIKTKIVHNCSFLNKLGNIGIQLYKFGRSIFVDNCSKENIVKYVEAIESNLIRNLNTHIFLDKSDETLGSQMISILSDLCIKGSVFKSDVSIIVLFKENNLRNFDYFSINDVCDHRSIESIAVCATLDCIEEEYLKKMKEYKTARNKNCKEGVFNVIGLGLGKPNDITLEGKKLIEQSNKVFLEGYTSIMLGGKDELQFYFQKDIVVADREIVEQKSEEILNFKNGENVSFLVVGDPFGATTHSDIILRSMDMAKDIVLVNNASIINSIGISGLKPSKFGGIVSIPFWSENCKPDSFYDKIVANSEIGLHTLCLLDIKVKEQSIENLMRGRKIYEKPRYMSVSVAAQQLLECNKRKCKVENYKSIINENTLVVCMLRIGTDQESIKHHKLNELPSLDFGSPLHSLIIVGTMDEDEKLLNN